MRGIERVFGETWPTPMVAATLERMNKPGGYMCVSCAWPKPANYHPFEFCENGAKATLWEMTSARCTPAFWETHTVSELRSWVRSRVGTRGPVLMPSPMRYDRDSDRYVEVGWDEAFAEIGRILKSLPRRGRILLIGSRRARGFLSLGAHGAAVWQNNLPQSSNMCHETTSVGLKKVIGSPVGTVIWEDLENRLLLLFRSESGHQLAALPASVEGREGSRCQDRHLQSGARAGPDILHRSIQPL